MAGEQSEHLSPYLYDAAAVAELFTTAGLFLLLLLVHVLSLSVQES